jgi:hypothetical protein
VRFACFDPVVPGYPIRLTVHGSLIRLSLEQARDLRTQLQSAIVDASLEDVPETDPAPPVDAVTRRDSPQAMSAVRVCPECGKRRSVPQPLIGACLHEFHLLGRSSQNLRQVTEELRSLTPKDGDPKP